MRDPNLGRAASCAPKPLPAAGSALAEEARRRSEAHPSELIRINQQAHELPAFLGQVGVFASSCNLAAHLIAGINFALLEIRELGSADSLPIRLDLQRDPLA